MRDRSSLWSMLKAMPLDSVARYSLTGMVTSPNWMAPFHIARATVRNLVRAPDSAGANPGRRSRDGHHSARWQARRPPGRSRHGGRLTEGASGAGSSAGDDEGVDARQLARGARHGPKLD